MKFRLSREFSLLTLRSRIVPGGVRSEPAVLGTSARWMLAAVEIVDPGFLRQTVEPDVLAGADYTPAAVA